MINKSSFSWDLFHEIPVVGIIRGMPFEHILKVVELYYEAGLYTVEITLNTDSALNVITTLRKRFAGLNVGAGTVCTLEELKDVENAGAQFVVSPIIDESVIKHCQKQNLPVFPGAYTPNEIYRAWTLGATAVKVFPATQLGVRYIKDVAAPLDQIKLLPTGGVALNNILSFFDAGAYGVGMGSGLFRRDFLQEQNYTGLKEHFNQIRQTLIGRI